MPSEYAFRITYTNDWIGLVLTHNHVLRVGLADGEPAPAIGADLADINLITKGVGGIGGSVAADAALGAYLTAFCGLYGDETVVTSAILSYYPTGIGGLFNYVAGADFTDVATYPNQVGNNVADSDPAQQATFTFVDGRGKTGRMILQETVGDGVTQSAYASLLAHQAAYVDYVLGSTSIVRSVDNTRPVAFKRWSQTKNEATYNRRFRQ